MGMGTLHSCQGWKWASCAIQQCPQALHSYDEQGKHGCEFSSDKEAIAAGLDMGAFYGRAVGMPQAT
jgi:hypothetical protein